MGTVSRKVRMTSSNANLGCYSTGYAVYWECTGEQSRDIQTHASLEQPLPRYH